MERDGESYHVCVYVRRRRKGVQGRGWEKVRVCGGGKVAES